MGLKSKKGSSLIAVVLIFAVLSISGISILSLTVSDYNARITASKKVQSLYASDSGVNAVYGIMKKVTSQGTLKGNKAVNDYMKTFDGSLGTDALKLKIDSIFKESYEESISSYILNNITYPNEYLKNGSCIDLDGNTISINDIIDATNPPIITVKVNLAESFPVIADKWVINITSQFATKSINGQTSNRKTVSADIVLGNYGYQGSYSVNPIKKEISINPVWKNAISIDGDMHINSDITVNGDIFVKGKPPVVATENVYTKYNGGITIGSDSSNAITANFNKNVITSNSFNISGQNKTVNVEGNIYAANVYIGKTSNSVVTDSSNCKLIATNGMVYTSNDLSLNATKSNITIGKYYGINASDKVRTVDEDYNSSSGIIVNSSDIGTLNGSSIAIGDAIINGTAYINTDTPYQTGESVAIKGNYSAYTVPIPKSTGTLYDEDKVDFAYNSPLQLVNNFKNPNKILTGADKAEYFRKIDENHLVGLKKSGITITNLIYSVGVAISNGGIMTKSFDPFETGEIVTKQNEFAKMVYEMGDITHLGVPINSNTSKMLNDDYVQGKINKTVFDGDEEARTDADGYQTNKIAQVTLNKVDDSKKIDINNNEVEVRANSKNVVLLGEDATYTPDVTKDEVIDLTAMNGVPHGIIITSGNVTLSGKVDFTGSIIAGGDLTTINDGAKTLTNDDDDINYMFETIASDYTNTYSKVFNENTKIGTQTVEIATKVERNLNETNAAIAKVIKLSNWRVNN